MLIYQQVLYGRWTEKKFYYRSWTRNGPADFVDTTGRGREMDQILLVVDGKSAYMDQKADRGRKPIIFLELLDERVFNCCARWTMINPKQSVADELLDNMQRRASLYNVKTAKRGQCYAKTTDVGRSVIQKGACHGRACSKVWALDEA